MACTTRAERRRCGDHVLAPWGWTSYPHRLRYQAHDVTDLVRAGGNVLEVLLGNGWYRGRLGCRRRAGHYGDRLALLAQLEVRRGRRRPRPRHRRLVDGARSSGVLADDLYDGQRTDLRPPGPITPASTVEVLELDLARLVAPGRSAGARDRGGPAVESSSPSGATIVDFGQNLVGRVRLQVRDPARAGRSWSGMRRCSSTASWVSRPLRSAKATDTYLPAGRP